MIITIFIILFLIVHIIFAHICRSFSKDVLEYWKPWQATLLLIPPFSFIGIGLILGFILVALVVIGFEAAFKDFYK